MQRIQKVQLKPQEGPEDVDGSQLSSSCMQKRKVHRAFMQAQKCWEHVKTRADEIFSKITFSRSRSRRGDARVHERRETVHRTREGK